MNLVETFSKLVEELSFDLILAIFRGQNGLKIWPTGAILHTPLKVPTMCLQNQVSASGVHNFWRIWRKTSKNQHFYLFFVKKNPSKILKAKNQNSNSTGFWAILLCTCMPNIGKIG